MQSTVYLYYTNPLIENGKSKKASYASRHSLDLRTAKLQHVFILNKLQQGTVINLLTTNVPIIQKPVSWFAEQIN